MFNRRRTVFERHPRLTVAAIVATLSLLLVAIMEIAASHYMGLGNPVLFERRPHSGYRLQPNQETSRFYGAHFSINNLGLRAAHDWDENAEDKILFLGDSVTYGGNHISDTDLFSSVAVRRLADFESGNAGIPNWGVENVYGLVVEESFLPAHVYVTTLIENDFYRGVASGENMPWISYESPQFALIELGRWLWYLYIANPREQNVALLESEPTEVRLDRAVQKLKLMDDFLKSRGFRHLILISPTREQLVGDAPKDPQVERALHERHVEVVYLLDKLEAMNSPQARKEAWYHDDVHLTREGHEIWGELIERELVASLDGICVNAKCF